MLARTSSLNRILAIGALALVGIVGLSGCVSESRSEAADTSSTGGATPSGAPTRLPTGEPAPEPSEVTPIEGASITAVGDSVMLASSEALRDALPGIDIHAEVSNQLENADEEIADLAAAGMLREVVVIGLGINGVGREDAARDAISAADGRKVVFVDVHGPGSYVPSVNDALRSVARSGGAAVALWDDAISQHPDLLARDGIHPGDEGAQIYAEAVVDALTRLR